MLEPPPRGAPKPPEAAEALLSCILPERDRVPILGDLAEEHDHRSRTGGAGAAAAWYWVQVARSVIPASRRRFRRRKSRMILARPGEPGGWGPGLAISWIDVKLGIRMLGKQPVMTCVAVFALAIGIPVGMYPMHLIRAIQAPLPFDEGERIQVLRHYNLATSDPQAPSLGDLELWREELASFDAIGATTLRLSFNVVSDDAFAAPVAGAQLTASTFDILRTGPLLGRTLIASDEVVGAPPVVVIGYDLWRTRFGSDADIVGRVIRVGRTSREVVGVMPQGFLFPHRDRMWIPLPASRGAAGPSAPILVFGRLAEGVSSEEAHAELALVGRRMAIDQPETHARLRGQVVSFAMGYLRGPRGGYQTQTGEYYGMNGVALMVLLVACANVAMLVLARTAARSTELAVRTALGASRSRVVSQLFAESLVFAVLAAGLGLWVGDRVVLPSLAWLLDEMPYWIDFGVKSGTVLVALSLAVLSAAVVGVVPALKATGRSVHRNIQRAAAGRSGIRFGGISSGLIVADVALSVATIGVAVALSHEVLANARHGLDIRADEFLAVEFAVARSNTVVPVTPAARDSLVVELAATQEELIRRLRAEGSVRGVAIGSRIIGMRGRSRIELDVGSGDYPVAAVMSARVDPGFFDALGHPVLAGRGFDPRDAGDDRSAVVVNSSFVERVMRGRDPIGLRLRYAGWREEPGPWLEVVGVVGDLGMNTSQPGVDEAMYHPMALGELDPIQLAVHVDGDPGAFTARLRAIASEVEPAAIVSDPRPLDQVVTANRAVWVSSLAGVAMLVFILISLSASGIYSLISFTVTERTREIGIRTALGAHRGRIALTIGRRSLAQLGIGIVLGTMATTPVFLAGPGGMLTLPTWTTIALMFTIGLGAMVAIGAMACTLPLLRALRIAPTEALQEGR